MDGRTPPRRRPLSKSAGYGPVLAPQAGPLGYEAKGGGGPTSPPRVLRRSEQDVPDGGRVPPSPALGGRHPRLVQIFGDLPQRVAACTLPVVSAARLPAPRAGPSRRWCAMGEVIRLRSAVAEELRRSKRNVANRRRVPLLARYAVGMLVLVQVVLSDSRGWPGVGLTATR